MRHRAEACFIDTEDVAADLGHFETATEARSACAAHADVVLSWQQTWEGMRQAQGKASWHQVGNQRSEREESVTNLVVLRPPGNALPLTLLRLAHETSFPLTLLRLAGNSSVSQDRPTCLQAGKTESYNHVTTTGTL